MILGFPSNDFGRQEPKSNAEIAEFCDRTYAVKFPMFGKTSVAPGASPLFDMLAQATGERPRWNFHKYVISRDGRAVASFPPGSSRSRRSSSPRSRSSWRGADRPGA